ncbi:MAG: NUDIX hydrolase [Alphaproteobacteria bacterium]|nr:NUDIX hydrolase [Alphaproteobacteria bacterium]
MNRRVDIAARKLLLDDFLTIEEVRLAHEKFDGTMSGAMRRVIVPRPDAVAAVVVNAARQSVVLIRQFRYAAYTKGDGWMIEVAAGLIDDGETPEQAIRREVLEETGYEAGTLARLGRFYVSPGYSSERVILFLAETHGEAPVAAGGGLAHEDEDIEVVEWPFDEAFRRLDAGEFVDAKTIIALSALRERLRRRAER